MKRLKVMSLLSILNFLAVIYVTLNLPDKVPVHINIAGEIDRYASRWSVPAVALVALVTTILMRVFYNKTTTYDETEFFPFIISLFLLIISWVPVFAANLGGGKLEPIGVMSLITVTMGAFFMVMGNFMGKIKQNRFLGVRTIRTLKSEYVWRKTHRFTGYLMVICGFIATLSGVISYFVKNQYLALAGIILIILSSLAAIIYSYLIKDEG